MAAETDREYYKCQSASEAIIMNTIFPVSIFKARPNIKGLNTSSRQYARCIDPCPLVLQSTGTGCRIDGMQHSSSHSLASG